MEDLGQEAVVLYAPVEVLAGQDDLTEDACNSVLTASTLLQESELFPSLVAMELVVLYAPRLHLIHCLGEHERLLLVLKLLEGHARVEAPQLESSSGVAVVESLEILHEAVDSSLELQICDDLVRLVWVDEVARELAVVLLQLLVLDLVVGQGLLALLGGSLEPVHLGLLRLTLLFELPRNLLGCS